mgnify:CR=1 FL=1
MLYSEGWSLRQRTGQVDLDNPGETYTEGSVSFLPEALLYIKLLIHARRSFVLPLSTPASVASPSGGAEPHFLRSRNQQGTLEAFHHCKPAIHHSPKARVTRIHPSMLAGRTLAPAGTQPSTAVAARSAARCSGCGAIAPLCTATADIA